jgi:hypothetical protein
MARSKIIPTLLAITFSLASGAQADEQEHGSCTCKNVDAGASSTLKGGLCTRTEKAHCLMEWDSGATTKVSEGNGISQEAALTKADDIMGRALGGDYQLKVLAQSINLRSSLEYAVVNLSSNPPEKYGAVGIAESFVLAATTALVRFDGLDVEGLVASLLRENRQAMLSAVQHEGSFSVKDFKVSGVTGCLKVSKEDIGLRVFVKTPFARDETC